MSSCWCWMEKCKCGLISSKQYVVQLGITFIFHFHGNSRNKYITRVRLQWLENRASWVTESMSHKRVRFLNIIRVLGYVSLLCIWQIRLTQACTMLIVYYSMNIIDKQRAMITKLSDQRSVLLKHFFALNDSCPY